MSKRKSQEQKGPNSEYCEFLLELAEYEKNVNRNIHKYNAYRNAASSLSKHTVKITSGKEAKAIRGIGQKIADKIDEFIQTGQVQKLEKIRKDDTSQAINLLTKISGIGPSTAQKLVNEGITTIEALRKHTDKLNHHQKIGLKYFEDLEMKIPREEMIALEGKVVEFCKKMDKRFVATVCGSYRRGSAMSGDIDILLTHPSFVSSSDKLVCLLFKHLIQEMKKSAFIIEQLSFGDDKFMGVCRLQEGYLCRRIDIRFCPQNEYYCAILYFTGSGLFNQQMRAHALEKGFTLSESCIRPIGSRGTPGEPLPVTCEQDIFEYIDYPYKEPHERNV